VVVVVGGVDDPQNLQDGVGEVGVPATGAEAHLAEDLAVAKRLERRRITQETVERLVVQPGDERVPDALDASHVALAVEAMVRSEGKQLHEARRLPEVPGTIPHPPVSHRDTEATEQPHPYCLEALAPRRLGSSHTFRAGRTHPIPRPFSGAELPAVLFIFLQG
jgi:hypothetical protein